MTPPPHVPPPRLFGKSRGWYSELWIWCVLAVAGTTAQTLAGRASDTASLAIHYGPRRVVAEGLRIVRHKPLVVSNGDAIGTEPGGAVLAAFATFFSVGICVALLLPRLLPRGDRAAFDAKRQRASDVFDGANFLIGLAIIFGLFVTLGTLVPKAVVAMLTVAGGWVVEWRFGRLARDAT